MIGKRQAITVGLALLTALALPQAPGAGAEMPRDADRAEIQALLDRRAHAVRTHDSVAFMATISNDSPEFVARQREFFAALEGVPMESYRLRAAWERFGDLARPSDQDRYDGVEDVAIATTEERYRIAGFDREASVEDIFFTFVKREGRWRIAEDADLDDLTLFSTRHLWDFGPVEQQRSEHFVAFAHDCDGSCEALLAAAEAGLDRVNFYWRQPWRRRVVLLVPGDSEELSRILQATFDVDEFVAFAYSTVDSRRNFDLSGHRVIVNPAAFVGRSGESSLGVLAHELLHVATRELSSSLIPVFVEEGLAEFVGRGHQPDSLAYFRAEVGSGSFDGRLPEEFQFLIGDQSSIYLSYQESLAAIDYFVQRFGMPKLVSLYKKLGAREVSFGTARYRVEKAFRTVTGKGLAAFERAWAADSIGGS